ncbi:hypothetical protein HOY82DRAFT_669020 [Tuber indicum]|nr:hypothetical protein HOY82DRAFT_669020 [Tuber indicum]
MGTEISTQVDDLPHPKATFDIGFFGANSQRLYTAIGKEGLAQGSNNEGTLLATVKLDEESTWNVTTREPLATARHKHATDRAWVKSIAFECKWESSNTILDLINHGLQLFPRVEKLWVLRFSLSLGLRNSWTFLFATASQWPNLGYSSTRASSSGGAGTTPLWTRSLWQNLCKNAYIPVSCRQGESGTSHSHALLSVLVEAMEKAGNDPILYVTIAWNLWAERKLSKATN